MEINHAAIEWLESQSIDSSEAISRRDNSREDAGYGIVHLHMFSLKKIHAEHPDSCALCFPAYIKETLIEI